MRILSPQEESFRQELYAQGFTDQEIASAVGKASVTITDWRHRGGLPTKYNPVFEPRVPEQRLYEYLLGVIHGDGCVTCDKSLRVIKIIVSASDKKYKDVLKRIIEEAYGYQPREHMYNGCYHLKIHPKKIVAQFLGCKVDGRWIIPKLHHPAEYLAGLWDTDGYFRFCVGKYKNRTKQGTIRTGTCARRRIEICQKSNGNLRQTIPILKSLGLSPRIGHYFNTTKLGTFERDVLIIPSSDYARFQSVIPIKHPRKIVVLKKIVRYKPRWGKLKLTRAQVNKMCALHKIGLTKKEIAKLFNVSTMTVQRQITQDNHKNRYKKRVQIFLALETPKRLRDISCWAGISRKSARYILSELESRGLATHVPLDKSLNSLHGLTEEGKEWLLILKEFQSTLKIPEW